MGIPITEWSWLKASLPSSSGGINLRSASLHAPAAYLASASCSQELVGKMLGHPSSCSPHNGSVVAALSASASRPDWQTLEDINVPLRQHSLSLAIDEATHQRLLSSAPSTRARALVHSSALPHAGDWLNGVPSTALGLHLQDQEFRCCLYGTGWECHSTAPVTAAQSVGARRTPLETTRWGVEATGTELPATTLSVTSCSSLPGLRPGTNERGSQCGA